MQQYHDYRLIIVTVSFLSHPLDSVFAAHSGNPATRTCVQREEHLDVVQTQLHHQVNKNQSLYQHLVTFLLSLSSWILDNKGSVASCYKSHKRTLLWLHGANFPAQTSKHYWLYCQHCSFANRPNRSGIHIQFFMEPQNWPKCKWPRVSIQVGAGGSKCGLKMGTVHLAKS